jgi:hypothetical protein
MVFLIFTIGPCPVVFNSLFEKNNQRANDRAFWRTAAKKADHSGIAAFFPHISGFARRMRSERSGKHPPCFVKRNLSAAKDE